jgi:hypothetical protein
VRPYPTFTAPEAGHGVEILGAVGVDDGRAPAFDDHERLGFELPVGDDRMQDVVEVPASRRPSVRWS